MAKKNCRSKATKTLVDDFIEKDFLVKPEDDDNKITNGTNMFAVVAI